MATSQECLRDELDRRLGLRNLSAQWLRRHAAFSLSVITGPVCRADLRDISHGSLPWDLLSAHAIRLGTKVLVQIEDVINIAAADPRSSAAPSVLQFTLTDGSLEFVGVELEPLRGALSMKTTPGTKLVLMESTLVRRGCVLLTPKCISVLAEPAVNVWGADYEGKVAAALLAANVRNPRLSSFDSIAGGPRAAGASGTAALLPNMGGISGVDTGQRSDEVFDDDAFWAEAAAVADQTVPRPAVVDPIEAATFGTGAPGNDDNAPLLQTQSPPGSPPDSPPPKGSAAAAHDLCVVIPETPSDSDEPLDTVPSVMRSVANEHQNVIAERDIGRMDSDAVNNGEEDDQELVDSDIVMSSPDGDEERAGESELPVGRLIDIESTRASDVEETVYRVFARGKGSFRVEKPTDTLSCSVPIDDGTAVSVLSLDPEQEFTLRFTGGIKTGSEIRERMAKVEAQFGRIAKTEWIANWKNDIRMLRSEHGFARIVHSETSSLILDVSAAPPNGMVRGDVSNFPNSTFAQLSLIG